MPANVMDYFSIGYQTAPGAGVGNAIRRVIDMHDKLTMEAGTQAIKSASPLEQAKTGYYGTLAANPLAAWGNQMGGNLPQGYQLGYDAKGRPKLEKIGSTDIKRSTLLDIEGRVKSGELTAAQAATEHLTHFPEQRTGEFSDTDIANRYGRFEPVDTSAFGRAFGGHRGVKRLDYQGKPLDYLPGYGPQGAGVTQATTPSAGVSGQNEYAQASEILRGKGYNDEQIRQMLGE